jgi:hypothetical protein
MIMIMIMMTYIYRNVHMLGSSNFLCTIYNYRFYTNGMLSYKENILYHNQHIIQKYIVT